MSCRAGVTRALRLHAHVELRHRGADGAEHQPREPQGAAEHASTEPTRPITSPSPTNIAGSRAAWRRARAGSDLAPAAARPRTAGRVVDDEPPTKIATSDASESPTRNPARMCRFGLHGAAHGRETARARRLRRRCASRARRHPGGRGLVRHHVDPVEALRARMRSAPRRRPSAARRRRRSSPARAPRASREPLKSCFPFTVSSVSTFHRPSRQVRAEYRRHTATAMGCSGTRARRRCYCPATRRRHASLESASVDARIASCSPRFASRADSTITPAPRSPLRKRRAPARELLRHAAVVASADLQRGLAGRRRSMVERSSPAPSRSSDDVDREESPATPSDDAEQPGSGTCARRRLQVPQREQPEQQPLMRWPRPTPGRSRRRAVAELDHAVRDAAACGSSSPSRPRSRAAVGQLRSSFEHLGARRRWRSPVGSSARITFGLPTSARAMATRCISPPDISSGRCPRGATRRRARAASAARRSASARGVPVSRSGADV